MAVRWERAREEKRGHATLYRSFSLFFWNNLLYSIWCTLFGVHATYS